MTLYYYPNGRQMKCDGCGDTVLGIHARFWDALEKRRYCVQCGTGKGGIVPVPSLTTATQTEPTVSPRASGSERAIDKGFERGEDRSAHCDLCGQWYPGREGGMFYNADHTAYRVCAFCQRVILCQAHAKMAGFWVVAKRPKEEATT